MMVGVGRGDSCGNCDLDIWIWCVEYYVVMNSDCLCLDLVMTGFVPNIMALMSDDESAGCMLRKGLSAAGTLKLIAQPEMVCLHFFYRCSGHFFLGFHRICII